MLRRLFKWIVRLVLLLVVLVVCLLVFKDSILRAVIEHRVRKRTGMEMKIGKISSSLFSQVYTLENVQFYNPAEFGGTLFLNVSELHIEVSPADLAQRRVRVTLSRLNIAELNVVRNEEGRTNVFAIIDRVKTHTKKLGGWQKLFGDFKFTGIDTINVAVGKVRYLDLKDPKNCSEAQLNLRDQVYRNLNSRAELETDLILLWFASNGKLPLSVNDIVRGFFNHREHKTETTTAAPAPRGSNAPPVRQQ